VNDDPIRIMRATAVCIAVLALTSLAACGSSKPAYCSSRTNLENSVKGLTNLNASSGISGLKEQVSKIQTDVNTLVNQAKNDFPSQTSALKSSIDSFTSAINAISGTPSASQIGALATSASSVATSVKGFVDATSSKCS
jgi:maltose-binding protein MalE